MPLLTARTWFPVNLTSANLSGASMIGTNVPVVTWTSAILDLSDLRRATGFNGGTGAASLRGMIRPDGTVSSFALNSGETWLIRPDSLAVTVDGTVQVLPGAEVTIDGSVVGIQSGKRANWNLASGGKVTLQNNALLAVTGLQLSGARGLGPADWKCRTTTY